MSAVAIGKDSDFLTVTTSGSETVVAARGRWVTSNLPDIARTLRVISRASSIDLSGLEAIDTNGAWLVYRTAQRLGDAPVIGASGKTESLIEAVTRAVGTERRMRPRGIQANALVALMERLGRAAYEKRGEAVSQINFLGALSLALWGAILRPWRIRVRALVAQMEHTGLDALPIVGLLSFLIGVVLAFQGADQLRRFGAEIFTVNLVGLGVLREMGVLIASIVVAGRSGSAFTAQIGSMQVNQEIDALQALGVDPLEVLVIPRVLGLMLVMPLLVFYADAAGVLGGAVMTLFVLDIGVTQFIAQFQAAIPLSALWVGMSKAPLFAFVIGLVGCYQGLSVKQSAEVLGRRTTQAVVEAIFLVIVLDAILSVVFSIIGV
jgi:phospholipid/cholesterol/gamma-HCH transport system permease protein